MAFIKMKGVPDAPAMSISMTIPLFVRVAELIREDVKSDINLHIIIEKILELAQDKEILCMSEYLDIERANPR